MVPAGGSPSIIGEEQEMLRLKKKSKGPGGLDPLHVAFVLDWLKDTFYIGESGSVSKLSVYKEYIGMCKESCIEALSSALLGKLVHRAFPNIKLNAAVLGEQPEALR